MNLFLYLRPTIHFFLEVTSCFLIWWWW